MGPRRPLSVGPRALAIGIAVAMFSVGHVRAQSAPPAVGTAHPWLSLLPDGGAERPLAPVVLTPLDALDLSATVRGNPRRAAIGASLHARYRLDAASFLRRTAADAADLDVLHGALRELERRDARRAWFAGRCDGLWRAWQVELLDASPAPPSAAEAAYLAAVRDALARDASTPASAEDVDACRLEGWVGEVALRHDSPDAVAERAEATLSARAIALAHVPAPPTVWLEVDVQASTDAAARVAVRAGLELPFTLAGSGHVGLALDESGPGVAVSWHLSSVDERLTARHAGTSGPRDADAARLDAFQRRAVEARLTRADARRRWVAACGDATPHAVVACLESAAAAGSLDDGVLAAIDAEIGALHAMVALVGAAGDDLATLLGGGRR